MQRFTKLTLSVAGLVGCITLATLAPMTQPLTTRLRGLQQVYVEEHRLSKIANFPDHTTDRPNTIAEFIALNYAPAPVASQEGGHFDRPISVHLSTPAPSGSIHYTLDGSLPTPSSPRYTQPLQINQHTVLRFRTLQPNALPSPTVTQTYLIGSAFQLPVLSLVTDPINLWDQHLGLHAQYSEKGGLWRRHGYVEYLAPPQSDLRVRFPTRVSLHGVASRLAPKKSFRITYSLQDVVSTGAHPILTTGDPHPEKEVVIRNGGSQENYQTRLYNELFNRLYGQVGGITARDEPVMVLLNGQTWGIFNIYEYIDAAFLAQRFGAGEYDLIKVRPCSRRYRDRGQPACYDTLAGRKQPWIETQDFFNTQDLQDPAVFEQAAQRVDLDNLTDYWLFNLYAANTDWPFTNVYFFRQASGRDRRWKWLAWDSDFSFKQVRANGLPTLLAEERSPYDPNRNQNTLIVRKLLQNPTYQTRFARRMYDLLNTVLTPQRVEAQLDALVAQVQPDLSVDLQRWSIPESLYQRRVKAIRTFARRRPAVVRAQFRQQFQLGELRTLTLTSDRPQGGHLMLNAMPIEQFPWRGVYPQTVPLELRAVPHPGYEFVGWTDSVLGSQPTVQITLEHDRVVGAIFRAIAR